jgi:hypothetical protein
MNSVANFVIGKIFIGGYGVFALGFGAAFIVTTITLDVLGRW